jgi:hypothetical protein
VDAEPAGAPFAPIDAEPAGPRPGVGSDPPKDLGKPKSVEVAARPEPKIKSPVIESPVIESPVIDSPVIDSQVLANGIDTEKDAPPGVEQAPEQAPEKAPGQAPGQALWQALCEDLESLGMSAKVVRDHSVFECRDGAVLRVGFTTELILKRGRTALARPDVLALAQRRFPGVVKLEAVRRVAGAQQTGREISEARRQEHLEVLWEEARKDPRIAEVVTRLGAKIHEVIALGEPESA